MKKREFFDSKVKIISLEEFMEESNYLCNINSFTMWEDYIRPCEYTTYYKITPTLCIIIEYTSMSIAFGMDSKEKLEKIYVAYRDGINEYKIIDDRIMSLKEHQRIGKPSKKLEKEIDAIEKNRKLIPLFGVTVAPVYKDFTSYIKKSRYKTSIDKLMNKYVVLDVETNGLRKSNDDLLSFSIYDPSTGLAYNRFLPLELQPLVLTGFINGICDDDLMDAVHMTQDEVDFIYNTFHLRERVVLTYSGGKGMFDALFLQNYCKRHDIIGFHDLNYKNIKSMLPSVPFSCEGQLTKDNMCRIFGIRGIRSSHSSYNDCVLEWKLFEKIESECVFFIQEHLYKYNPEYIIPYTYLIKHQALIKYANIEMPKYRGKATSLYHLSFPNSLIKKIQKFPTNITGITIEHGINSYLKAKVQDNYLFLEKNKSNLEYIGSLDKRIKDIPILMEDDGTVKAIKTEDIEFINQVNDVTQEIINYIKPVADYLKNNILKGSIMTQELSISDDKKVLALCDLSDENNVVEIKTYDVFCEPGIVSENVANQLFFQAKGRNKYILNLNFKMIPGFYGSTEVNHLDVDLYKVDLFYYDSEQVVYTHRLIEKEIDILKAIKQYPDMPRKIIAMIVKLNLNTLNKFIRNLKFWGYIEKENPRYPKSKLLVVRDIDDVETKYKLKNGECVVVTS